MSLQYDYYYFDPNLCQIKISSVKLFFVAQINLILKFYGVFTKSKSYYMLNRRGPPKLQSDIFLSLSEER